METIKQKVISITVENRDAINVRRMAWKPALEFIRKFGAHAAAIKSVILPSAKGEESMIRFNVATLLDKLQDIIAGSEDLATHLIEHSTGLLAKEVAELDTLVAVEVLNAAIALNMGPELKNSLLGIGKTLSALFPSASRTNAGENSTPTT